MSRKQSISNHFLRHILSWTKVANTKTPSSAWLFCNAKTWTVALMNVAVLTGLANASEPNANLRIANVDGEEKVINSKPGPLELRALDYIRFRQDVAELESIPFDNSDVTREAHKKLASHESWALSSGWMAYAALIAADTPAFAQALQAELRGENDMPETKKKKRRKKKKKKQKELTAAELDAAKAKFLAKLSANPRYPRTLKGADNAMRAVIDLALNDDLRVSALGENFKSQAYAMQKTRWGKKRLASSSTRLSEAKTYGSTRTGIPVPQFTMVSTQGIMQPGIAQSSEANWASQWGHTPDANTLGSAKSQAIFDRVLNLAARYAVGAINDKVVTSYAKNKKSEQCLSLARLTLNQCIAATRTPYEEAFCLGEHALNDVSGCISEVAGS